MRMLPSNDFVYPTGFRHLPYCVTTGQRDHRRSRRSSTHTRVAAVLILLNVAALQVE